jgi:DNA-binding response OmpR family regulator
MEAATRHNASILVVDDDSSGAQALAMLLRDDGYEAAVASSGAEGMAALAGGTCRVLLLDPALRDCTGLRVLRYARDLGVPTIVVTSNADFDPERGPGNEAGAFLYKPIHLPTLLGLIATALRPA